MTLFTIGYEGVDSDSFVGQLKELGIRRLIDVREIPLSRKPGFSKRALAARLDAEGIEYFHLRDLGCPKAIRDQYRADGDWKRYMEGFLQHLETQEETVDELVTLASDSASCLVCFEADSSYCHRSLVAAEVQRISGIAVSHIRATRVKIVPPAQGLDLAFA